MEAARQWRMAPPPAGRGMWWRRQARRRGGSSTDHSLQRGGVPEGTHGCAWSSASTGSACPPRRFISDVDVAAVEQDERANGEHGGAPDQREEVPLHAVRDRVVPVGGLDRREGET